MSRIRLWAAGTIVAVLAVLASAAPASAHDQLISSNPAIDAQLTTAPAQVTLRFSADVLDTGAAIIVVDADGKDHVSGAVAIDGPDVSAALGELPVGGYQVRWRVVSSDGHPISGIVPFTVGDAAPLPLPTAAAPAADPEAAPVQTQADAENSTAERMVAVGLIGAVLAVGVFVLITLLRRRSARSSGQTDGSPHSADAADADAATSHDEKSTS